MDPRPNDARFLPTEGPFAEYFTGTREQLVDAMFALMARISPLEDFSARYDIVRPPEAPAHLTNSPPASLQMLAFLVALLQPKRILEVGTFIGVSALYMAENLPNGGEIVTLEKYAVFAEAAKRNFAVNGKQETIRCIVGDGYESIAQLERDGKPFDFIFLDANKERYWDYFVRLDPLLCPGGVFLTDDTFMQGDVFNTPPTTDKGKGVLLFLERCSQLTTYDRVLLPLIDGWLLMRKH